MSFWFGGLSAPLSLCGEAAAFSKLLLLLLEVAASRTELLLAAAAQELGFGSCSSLRRAFCASTVATPSYVTSTVLWEAVAIVLAIFMTFMNFSDLTGVPGALYLCVTSLVRISSHNLVR